MHISLQHVLECCLLFIFLCRKKSFCYTPHYTLTCMKDIFANVEAFLSDQYVTHTSFFASWFGSVHMARLFKILIEWSINRAIDWSTTVYFSTFWLYSSPARCDVYPNWWLNLLFETNDTFSSTIIIFDFEYHYVNSWCFKFILFYFFASIGFCFNCIRKWIFLLYFFSENCQFRRRAINMYIVALITDSNSWA